jgi:hypothetical protein
MRDIPFIGTLVIATSFLSGIAGASGQAARAEIPPLERMPAELETRFALSALPAPLREGAGVSLLDPAVGYVRSRASRNGFNCIVERTEWNREDFRSDLYTPLCYDAEGSRNHLRVWLDVAALRAGGKDAGAVRAEIERRFRKGIYKAPRKPGLSYMVAPLMRTYPNPDPKDKTVVTMPMPHVMYYAPGVTQQEVGATPPPSPFPFVLEAGPHGYMIQLLGETEKAAILAEHKLLLADLCSYRELLCLSPTANHAPNAH